MDYFVGHVFDGSGLGVAHLLLPHDNPIDRDGYDGVGGFRWSAYPLLFHSEGVTPIHRRKAAANFAGFAYPTADAVSVTDISDLSKTFARSILLIVRYL